MGARAPFYRHMATEEGIDCNSTKKMTRNEAKKVRKKQRRQKGIYENTRVGVIVCTVALYMCSYTKLG